MVDASPFAFAPFDFQVGDGVTVGVVERRPADPVRGFVPCYAFEIWKDDGQTVLGSLFLRVGDTHFVRQFAGHVGYEVDPEHRGHGYAARACQAMVPFARWHGMTVLWLTVEPTNHASRKTCERLGCELVEIVELPPDCDMYQEGQRHKCRYRWDL